MIRWLALAVAIALVGGGVWLMVRAPGPVVPESSASHPEIDDASRAALDRVLKEADREKSKQP